MSHATTPAIDGPAVPRAAIVRHRPLPFDAVRLDPGSFLGRWQSLNRDATIPHVLAQLEASGTIDNFRRLVGRSDAPAHRGFNFVDSDVYKTLEALAWEAGRVPDDQPWEGVTQELIELLAAVQRDDGYLHTLYAGDEVFADLRWGHELYVLGHLVQGAVARARTTGRTDLLDVARRFADLAVARFGEGGEDGYCGHPEVETALVELYRLTGEQSYLDLARRQVDLRGSGVLGSGPFPPAYHQDHAPVREVTEVTGHAVRQAYLAAGVADVVAETGDPELLAALLRLWDSAQGTSTYVTGGTGSRHKDEAFGDPFELPPDRAYAETCAAIATFQWAWRMLLLTGEGRFADEMERTLYNAIPASTSVAGTGFLYANPLQVRTGRDGSSEFAPSERLPWFACACCPPNLARLVASLQDYVATRDESGVQLHLYADADVSLGPVRLTVRTEYPWDGRVVLDAGPDGLHEDLSLRIPAWADVGAVRLVVDGRVQEVLVEDGYVRVAGPVHRVELELPMPVVAVAAHPRVDAVRGCVALRRGPVVYCVEQAGLPPGVVLEDVALVPGSPLSAAPPVAGVDALVSVEAVAVHRPASAVPLYRPSAAGIVATPAPEPVAQRLTLRAVPYHRWGSRGPGAMRVWLPVAERP
ncbi:beta-L-arabinofuranosidase domain-containing protein [uncultured Cellulomonas sp.]|uniref:glycoside hydrolase family 127 protein n=1 Tax=uncultured Cellulomonas sp. TaxID=189682 RepID=UPI0028EEC0FC|nr:beta-L-arabinofuranosidase domain-containing protein [uncultured Cellulomonas sp.]